MAEVTIVSTAMKFMLKCKIQIPAKFKYLQTHEVKVHPIRDRKQNSVFFTCIRRKT